MNQIEDISIPILIINPHNKSRVKVEDILKKKKTRKEKPRAMEEKNPLRQKKHTNIN